jgi:DNA-binding transcriptional LysR family regulator
MIERYQLRYFLAVVNAGNVSRAAAEVNVSQPALSVGIAKLEAALGAKLFRRNSQRVHLTEAGARLLARARLVEREFNSLGEGLSDKDLPQVLRIGVLTTLPTRMLRAVVLANAAADIPDPLEIVEGSERDLLERLQRRRIDLALTVLRPKETRFPHVALFTEGYSLVAPKSHPLAGQAQAPGEAFANDTMIVRRHCEVLSETSRYFLERGVRPHFAFRSTNDDRTLELVRAGLGVTVAPDSCIGPGLAAIKLAGFNPRRQIGLLFADETLMRQDSPALIALQGLVRLPSEPRREHQRRGEEGGDREGEVHQLVPARAVEDLAGEAER